MLGYLYNQSSNILQLIIDYFFPTNNVPKYCIELLHHMVNIILSKTICQKLKTNVDVILNYI